MKILKDYLTMGEIKFIVGTISKMDDFLDREVCKILLVAKFCTDFNAVEENNGEYDFSVELYNNLYASGEVELLYSKIRNIKYIDDALNEIKSANLLNDFSNMFTVNPIDENDMTEKLYSSLNELKDILGKK